MKKEKSCGCVVFNEEKKVLIIKSVLGHYDLPKGHMEINESEIETATRELKEETNIDVEVISNLRYRINYSPYENTNKEVIYFLAKAKNNEIKTQKEEVSFAEFVSLKEALSLLTFDNTKEVLTYFINNLNK